MTTTTRGRLVAQLVLVAAMSALVVAFVQRQAPGLYGYDGPFHIRYAELLRHDLSSGHGFSDRFPWWQETFLKDRWADKDLLFHLLLMPFTYGDLGRGGKVASILFGTAFYAGLFLALRWARAPAPALWTLGALVSSTVLLYRGGLLRSHVLAIPIAALGAVAIVRGSRPGVFLASAAYAWTHIGWQLLPGIALLHDALATILERRARAAATTLSMAGVAAAVLVNPGFPANLSLWRVQNIDVLGMAWSTSAPDLSLGTEFLPAGAAFHLTYNPGAVLFTVAGIVMSCLAWRGGRASPVGPLTFGAVTLGFAALSFASRRFSEFWAPFSAMFAATAAGWLLEGGRPALWSRRGARLAAAAGLAGIGLLGVRNVSEASRIASADPGRLFAACADWIRDNVPAGKTVFTTDWDEFPDLFFTAPEQHYLVGLDPTFMYVTSPERWRAWRNAVERPAANLYDVVEGAFRCRHVFADAGYEEFVERADQDPLFRIEVKDPDCSVYSLLAPADDAAEREQAAPVRLGAWRTADGASFEPGPRDFVLLDSARDGECEVLVSEVISRASGRATLVFSTDDRIQIVSKGRQVYDSVSAPPPSLEEVLDRRNAGARGPFEHRVGLDVEPGAQQLTLTTCRVGLMWGFHARVAGLTPVGGIPRIP